jgi:hypothetical protein
MQNAISFCGNLFLNDFGNELYYTIIPKAVLQKKETQKKISF